MADSTILPPLLLSPALLGDRDTKARNLQTAITFTRGLAAAIESARRSGRSDIVCSNSVENWDSICEALEAACIALTLTAV